MNRTGLLVALLLAGASGIAFGFFPSLDLEFMQTFYKGPIRDTSGRMLAWYIAPPFPLLQNILVKGTLLLVIPALLALLLKLFMPQRKMLVSGRGIIFLISTLIIIPGLIVNTGLKEHWGRPRPLNVTEFGGPQHFVAWWNPTGDCVKNCSFVSGDVAAVTWAVAPAALLPPFWRVVAIGVSLAAAGFVGVMRMMAGGHFPSDVIFAAAITFVSIWLVYALIFRWKSTRLSDDGVESWIARFAMSLRSMVSFRRHKA